MESSSSRCFATKALSSGRGISPSLFNASSAVWISSSAAINVSSRAAAFLESTAGGEAVGGDDSAANALNVHATRSDASDMEITRLRVGAFTPHGKRKKE